MLFLNLVKYFDEIRSQNWVFNCLCLYKFSGIRGCKVVISCVTPKYSLSANCRREVSLADALKKPIIPILLEETPWPPEGTMSMVFTQLLYIDFHTEPKVQDTWTGEQMNQLLEKLKVYVPEMKMQSTIAKTTGFDAKKQWRKVNNTRVAASQFMKSTQSQACIIL